MVRAGRGGGAGEILGLTFYRLLETLHPQTSSPPWLVLSYLLPWIGSFPAADHLVTVVNPWELGVGEQEAAVLKGLFAVFQFSPNSPGIPSLP